MFFYRQIKSFSLYPAIASSLLIINGCAPQPDAEVLTEVPWALFSRPLVIDTHSHTDFSDGDYAVNKVVELAIEHGCDALAITDHADLAERAASPNYFSAINNARKAHPGFILFGGIEWNIPPYGGREHVTVLLDPAIEEAILGPFKQQFEQQDATAEEALEWLADKSGSLDKTVLIYNHPGRKDDSTDENLLDILAWRNINKLFIGFEGAPGHQKTQPVGSYKHKIQTRDRWDPVAADIGGNWDTLLDQGENIVAALAVSDFHNNDLDYAPCEFARIHVYPQEHSARGILAGLRAGSFWADHGHIIDDLFFTLSTPALPNPVTPGEIVRMRSDQPINLTVLLQRGAAARESRLIVELIGNSRSGTPELLHKESLSPDENRVDWTITGPAPGADGSSVYFRIRIRKVTEEGEDLMAYTNAIRVITH